MDTRRSVRPWSRRRFLGTFGVVSGALLVAACGQPATPAAPAATSAPAKPADAKPTEAAKPAAPAGAPAATTAPAAAAKPAEPDLQVVSGVFNIWFSANWNELTDKAIGDAFVAWGEKNGGQKVQWQSIP